MASQRFRLALVLSLCGVLTGAPSVLASEAAPTRREIEPRVMCPSCRAPLDRSSGPAADRMRAYIDGRIADGWTRSKIIDGLVDEYGGPDRVLAQPPTHGRGLWAWLGPVLLSILILGIGSRTLMRWRRPARDQ